MTRTTLYAVTFLAAAALAHVSPRGQSANGPPKDAQARRAAVGTTLERLFQAAEQGRIDEVEGLHSYGPEFSKFDEFGLGREDAVQARAAERAELAGAKSFRAHVRELKVDLFGELALATFVVDYTAETGQGTAAASLRSTVAFRNERGEWRIVHEHYSRLVAPQ